jgi:hypothetical protein
MKHMFGAFAMLVALNGIGPAAAGTPAINDAKDGRLTPQARGELTGRFVRKWGAHIERVYDVPVGVWARRMVPTFVVADPINFRNALKRATFEGAMAELTGTGHRLSDDRAMRRLAAAALGSPGEVGAKVLGDLDRDLLYTPLQPCRIVDTRNTAGGQIAAGGTRDFIAVVGFGGGYTSQGGSATDCGTPGIVPSALALNVTAVTPDRAGFTTVYPFGSPLPLAASVNYTAGAIVNNAIITKTPNPLLSSDFTIYSFGSAHYVVDIVGYFAPSKATALQCTSTYVEQFVAAGSTFIIPIPGCPLSETMTAAACTSSGSSAINWSKRGFDISSGGAGFPLSTAVCSGNNPSAFDAVIRGAAQCCRIPGR